MIKDQFLAYEEFLKENIEMSNGDLRISLQMHAGETYNKGLYLIKKYPNVRVLALVPLQTSLFWKDLL